MIIKLIRVEVAYATPSKQDIIALQVEIGSTIGSVIQRSGILHIFPEIDLVQQKVGVFGKVRELTDLVGDGDRIEIYRALLIDPMEARRKRVIKKKRIHHLQRK